MTPSVRTQQTCLRARAAHGGGEEARPCASTAVAHASQLGLCSVSLREALQLRETLPLAYVVPGRQRLDPRLLAHAVHEELAAWADGLERRSSGPCAAAAPPTAAPMHHRERRRRRRRRRRASLPARRAQAAAGLGGGATWSNWPPSAGCGSSRSPEGPAARSLGCISAVQLFQRRDQEREQLWSCLLGDEAAASTAVTAQSYRGTVCLLFIFLLTPDCCKAMMNPRTLQ